MTTPAAWDDVVTAAFRTTIDRAARGVATLDERALMRTYAETLLADLDRYEEVVGELNEANTDSARQAARAEQRADRLAATLREVLDAFRTVRDDGTREVVGYMSAPIHPTDMARWRAVLDQTQEPTVPDHKRILIDAPDGSTILAARHLDATEGRVQIGSTVDASTRSAINRVLGYVAKAHNSPTARTDGQAEAAIARVRALHREEYGGCAECTHESSVLWPCATIRTLDGEEPQP